MKTEEGWEMYIDIKRLKSKGFSHSKIAKMLGISRPTVIKYINMSTDEFEKELKSRETRIKKPSVYENEIVTWLKQYPEMSSAQIYDWLEEKYNTIQFNEGTLRNFVRFMRKQHNIPKELCIRQYEAVDELPMGKQMQVDFGEKKVCNSEGKLITLYVMCFVLSHSRYKYCEWQGRPFTTKDIIQIHENAFDYFGGFPEEAVYDQDHLILVSENHGELIYTKEFAAYLQKRKFRVYMCRKADPESKGKVEKVVDFVKDNFASHRTFYNIDRWNEDCMKWLKRRGNGKMHATIRKIPAEVFIEEKKYLTPVTDKIITFCNLSITYQVRKDNTVPISGNRYSVPRGTYKGPHTYVGVKKMGNSHLIIFDLESKKELAHHEIPQTKGNLQRNNNHVRETSSKVSKLIEDIAQRFPDYDKARFFLEEIHKQKPRYTRDQLALIDKMLKGSNTDSIANAVDYCIKNNLYNAVDFKDAVKHYSRGRESVIIEEPIKIAGMTEMANVKISANVQVRDISEYLKAMNISIGGQYVDRKH